MPRVINLTPHAISVYGSNSIEDGPQATYPASGTVARVATVDLGSTRVGGFNTPPVVYELVEYGWIENLPSPVENTLYIVSLVCALAVSGRFDIVAPYDEVRDDKGQIIGCRIFQKIA
jgi:hypothetical protein